MGQTLGNLVARKQYIEVKIIAVQAVEPTDIINIMFVGKEMASDLYLGSVTLEDGEILWVKKNDTYDYFKEIGNTIKISKHFGPRKTIHVLTEWELRHERNPTPGRPTGSRRLQSEDKRKEINKAARVYDAKIKAIQDMIWDKNRKLINSNSEQITKETLRNNMTNIVENNSKESHDKQLELMIKNNGWKMKL